MNPQELRIADFTYSLPSERIATAPMAERDASKLLTLRNGVIAHQPFAELPDLLNSNHLLVFNNSRVIRARLEFFKPTGARIELFCLEPDGMPIVTAMATTEPVAWKCYLGNAKRWKTGALVREIIVDDATVALSVEKTATHHDYYTVEFSWDTEHTFAQVLEAAGKVPLPPYIQRDASEADVERYQTVYAQDEGSVAAPTAGLHFSDEVLKRLHQNDVEQAYVTLHVGAGTFKPVSADAMSGHEMHEEPFTVNRAFVQQLGSTTRAIVPVGTTSMRTLESLYWLGVKALQTIGSLPDHIGQWEAYELAQDDLPSRPAAFTALLAAMDANATTVLTARTGILIAPGYTFRVCNALVTNFHQPGSTLLLLVAAFVGPRWREVYDFALANNFRFLSYGDSSLLMPG